MSAWLVFAMLGFYPAQPFSGEYVVGRAMVKAADLQVEPNRVVRVSDQVLGLNSQMPQLVSHAALLQRGMIEDAAP
jgi:putative alpha-1,2-mannosidase